MATTVNISETLAAGTYTLTAPGTAPTSPAAKRLGVNLTAIGSTNREYPASNWVKTSRRFGSIKNTFDQSAPLDENGWPTTDAGLYWDQCRDVNGDYQISIPGNVQLKAYQAALSKVAYDAAKNVTTAAMTINQAAGYSFGPALAVITGGKPWQGLTITPPWPVNGSFGQPFVDSLGDFACLRFMDWAKTNSSAVDSWASRAKPTDAQWCNGVPWEVCIELCNLLNCDGWFNIPCLANDDYIRQLAALIHSQLKPGLHAYIEYSNEIWNGIFTQYKQNAAATLAEIAAGDKTLALPGDPSPAYAQFRRVAKRSADIQSMCAATGAQGDRFRVVLPIGVDAGWQMVTKMIDWTTKNAGDPARIFYAIAGAPYFNAGKTLAQNTTATADQLLDGFEANAVASQGLKDASAYAHGLGLKFLCYEMGSDNLQYNVNIANKIAAQESPRMGGIVKKFLADVFQYADGGCWFGDADAYDKNTMFGLRQHVKDYTPKYLAATAFAEGLKA